MARIRFEAELDYDGDLICGDDEESKEWFLNQILGNQCGDLILHSNDVGDTVGTIRLIRILPEAMD